jgi:long-chain acyl-CoA synthetase
VPLIFTFLASPLQQPPRTFYVSGKTQRLGRAALHPAIHAAEHPAKAAIIMAATGATIAYAELDTRSNQSARLLRQLGLKRGDVIATLFGNGPEVFITGWAAQRSGLLATAISNKLSAADIAYILKDSGARLLIVAQQFLPLAKAALDASNGITAYCWGEDTEFPDWRAAAANLPDTPIPDQSAGGDMLYSSGTTGRPKGVKPMLPDDTIDAETPLTRMGQALYGMGKDSVYLSTSPLYHAAPLRWALAVQKLGGTVIVMERFDPDEVLSLIERHRVTHATFVPTHFVRMLKQPSTERTAHKLDSLQAVIHAAAPCPKPVKQAMIDWFGPIVHEYYSGTESCGITAIDSHEWLKRPGSVGRAILGKVHIVADDGQELPAGEQGHVYFSDGPRFEYLNDPEKTAGAHNVLGWATLGDIGYLDADGYLYLTDRKGFMIISGGVNIYPQEIENALISHPAVFDVGVVGIPDDEMGERVVAVVQTVDPISDTVALAEELRQFARNELGALKTPKEFRFADEMPREPTGKLIKRRILADIETYRR